MNTQQELGKVRQKKEMSILDKMRHKGIYLEQRASSSFASPAVKNKRFVSSLRHQDSLTNKSAILRALPAGMQQENERAFG